MFDTLLFFIHGTALVLFGVFLSSAFSGVSFTPKNILNILFLCAMCGGLQILSGTLPFEDSIAKLYPFTTHLPLVLFLCAIHRKRLETAFISVFTTYLLCQPAKWFAILTVNVIDTPVTEIIARLCTLAVVAYISLRYLAPYLSGIFNKDTRSVYIFAILPMVYYIFDYSTIVYTDLWIDNNRIVAEFLPFFMGIVYIIFCMVYYREHEQKADAERKEQIIRITAEQQNKEIAAIKRSEQEVRLLRHDMRLLLSSLALCIENGEYDKAKELASTYSSHIEGTRLERFCENDTINYILSDFTAKCISEDIDFRYTIELGVFNADEVIFASIISNALDNALNAQKDIPEDSRLIKMVLKSAENRILFSVENPTAKKTVFESGLPVSEAKGHGYGTQSIRYMAERLGGNCQFAVQNNKFITRVII